MMTGEVDVTLLWNLLFLFPFFFLVKSECVAFQWSPGIK
jgi:hypothetical protein